MANSEYGYVREFESKDHLPRSNWIVVRIDGRGFTKFTKTHDFQKPNDLRALNLANAAAEAVVKSFFDIIIAYGQSDEYSFIFHEDTTLFERRSSKLATSVVSTFTAEYCLQWNKFFPDIELQRPYPTFDGRCVCYPRHKPPHTTKLIRDYLSWRQADCHINNLYNTTFWNLVQRKGLSNTEAEELLKGTLASDKNEILFKEFGINYNNEPGIFRKGTVIYRAYEGLIESTTGRQAESTVEGKGDAVKGIEKISKTQLEKQKKKKQKARIAVEHVDIIGSRFWEQRPYILNGE